MTQLSQSETQAIETTHPLRAAVEAAETTLRFAQDAFAELNDELSGEDTYLEVEAAAEAVRKAEADLEHAQSELTDSDCPRKWALREEGFEYDTITAASAEEALGIARDNCDRANYPESTGTLYIDVRVSCEETGEDASETVTLEAPEPDCARGETHDWQSPHCLVGGLEENPGVHGHGGGVIVTEVCRHCGCKRVRDTYAQNPTNGQQGLESVEYEEDAYTAEELAEAFGEEA